MDGDKKTTTQETTEQMSTAELSAYHQTGGGPASLGAYYAFRNRQAATQPPADTSARDQADRPSSAPAVKP